MAEKPVDKDKKLSEFLLSIEDAVTELGSGDLDVQVTVFTSETQTPYFDAAVMHELIRKACKRKGKKVKTLLVGLDNTHGKDSFEITG